MPLMLDKFSVADRNKLYAMSSRGESDKTVIAFFTALGYPVTVVLQEIEEAKALNIELPPEDEGKKIEVLELGKPRKYGYNMGLVIILFLVAGIGIIFFQLFSPQLLPLLLPETPAKQWKVSFVFYECSPSQATLNLVNTEITGFPLTEFSIKENNASCSPLTSLSGRISTPLTCYGVFEHNTTYTLISNNTQPDADWCNFS